MDLIEYNIRESSLGNLLLVARNGRIIRLGISLVDTNRIKKDFKMAHPAAIDTEIPFRNIWKDLSRYFKGEKVAFNTEIDISNLRPFTRQVLEELRNIPYGELISYNWIGKHLGYSKASRAVGQAVGRNPIPIIIPCHRVIRENGSLGGFSSGINIKKRLLSIEGSIDRIKA